MPKTILAFDYGEVRIGAAFWDGNNTKTLAIINSKNAFVDVDSLIKHYHPELLLVGLPRTLDGNDSEQTTKARAFAQSLAAQYNVPMKLQDEALSSERARELLPAKATAKQQRERIDSLAASIILQDYLNESNTK